MQLFTYRLSKSKVEIVELVKIYGLVVTLRMLALVWGKLAAVHQAPGCEHNVDISDAPLPL